MVHVYVSSLAHTDHLLHISSLHRVLRSLGRVRQAVGLRVGGDAGLELRVAVVRHHVKQALEVAGIAASLMQQPGRHVSVIGVEYEGSGNP